MGDADRRRRRSIRHAAYDYAAPGAYFVTLCTHGRRCLFGTVSEDKVNLSDLGRIVSACWEAIPAHFPAVDLDAFVVMPNHVHGILQITASANPGGEPVGAQHAAPLHPRTPIAAAVQGVASGSLGAIIHSFKSASTRGINLLRGTPGAPVWQRNYYEHVIRNGDDLHSIRRYIADNPILWHLDPENPERTRPAESLRGE